MANKKQDNVKNENQETSVKLSLKVSKRNFVSEDGQLIKYFSYEVQIGDETFKLQPRPDDKRMLNYLLNDLFDNQKDESENVESDDIPL